MYTEIGEYTFYCTEITRQPVAEKVGGYDDAQGIYWSGVDIHYGYAYMQTQNKQYGFYLPIGASQQTLYTTDDFGPKDAVVLQGSDGTVYYIPAGYSSNECQNMVFATPYLSVLPKEDVVSEAAPGLAREE